jgi:hypothetical protein
MWGGDSCPPLLTFLNSATQYQKIPPKQSLKSGLQARPPHTSKPKQVLDLPHVSAVNLLPHLG